jgi:hypothetical protein
MIHLPLRRFEYCFTGPDSAAYGMKKVSIDFENEKLFVTREKIEVSATIYPGLTGGLIGFSADELIFSLEGTMRDSKRVNTCSGLLVLENLTGRHGSESGEWHATLYLYDDHIDGRELKISLTMYCPSENPERN